MKLNEIRGYIFLALGCLFLIADASGVGKIEYLTRSGQYYHAESIPTFMMIGVGMFVVAVVFFINVINESKKTKSNLPLVNRTEPEFLRVGDHFTVPNRFDIQLAGVDVQKVGDEVSCTVSLNAENYNTKQVMQIKWEAEGEVGTKRHAIPLEHAMLVVKPEHADQQQIAFANSKSCDRVFITVHVAYTDDEMEYQKVYEIYPTHYVYA